MKVTRYKNYRFSFNFDNYKITFSSIKKYEYIESIDDVKIDLWGENNEKIDSECSIQDFHKSKFGKILKYLSMEQLYRATIISVFKRGVVDYTVSKTESSIHCKIDIENQL